MLDTLRDGRVLRHAAEAIAAAADKYAVGRLVSTTPSAEVAVRAALLLRPQLAFSALFDMKDVDLGSDACAIVAGPGATAQQLQAGIGNLEHGGADLRFIGALEGLGQPALRFAAGLGWPIVPLLSSHATHDSARPSATPYTQVASTLETMLLPPSEVRSITADTWGITVIARSRRDESEQGRATVIVPTQPNPTALRKDLAMLLAPQTYGQDVMVESCHIAKTTVPIREFDYTCHAVTVSTQHAVGVALPDEPGVKSAIAQAGRAAAAVGTSLADADLAIRPINQIAPYNRGRERRAPPHVGPNVLLPVMELVSEAVSNGLAPAASDKIALVTDMLRWPEVDAVAVTIYTDHGPNCVTAWRGTTGRKLADALDSVLARSEMRESGDPRPPVLGIGITLIGQAAWRGNAPRAVVARNIDLGCDTVSLQSPWGVEGVLLDSVPAHYSWTATRFVSEVVRKAGRPGDRGWRWAIHPSTSWLSCEGETYRLDRGFATHPDQTRSSCDRLQGVARAVSDFVVSTIDGHGLPAAAVDARTGTQFRNGDFGRRLFALRAVAELSELLGTRDDEQLVRAYASQIYDELDHGWHVGGRLPRYNCDVIGEASICELLMLGVAVRCEGARADRLNVVFEVLRDSVLRADGRIAPNWKRSRVDEDHDFFPGAALQALCGWAQYRGMSDIDGLSPARTMEWYANRWNSCRSWGTVGWMPHAIRALGTWRGGSLGCRFAFELADWACERQLAKSGWFLCELDPLQPSFHTAYIAEALTSAHDVAAARGDRHRIARYRQAVIGACRRIDRLVIQKPDDVLMAPTATGAVRQNLASAWCRIDFAGHTLLALAGAIRLQGRSKQEHGPATAGEPTPPMTRMRQSEI